MTDQPRTQTPVEILEIRLRNLRRDSTFSTVGLLRKAEAEALLDHIANICGDDHTECEQCGAHMCPSCAPDRRADCEADRIHCENCWDLCGTCRDLAGIEDAADRELAERLGK